MKTPHHAAWLVALSLTSGHRSLDLLAVIDLMGEERSKAGALIGAASAPFWVVPAVAVISVIVLPAQVPGGILLFQKSGKPVWKRTLWSLFFGILAFYSFITLKVFSHACGYFLATEDFDLFLDAVYNLFACLGWIYLWLSYRAIVCYSPPSLAKPVTCSKIGQGLTGEEGLKKNVDVDGAMES